MSASATATSTADRILDAATELFLRDGYAATNLEQVAAAAGVTKPTIYSHFGCKEKLLEAVTRQFAVKPLDQLSRSLQASGDVRADLLRFAEVFTAIVFSQRAMQYRRFAAAESLTHPEVGKAFFESGPACSLAALADYLRQQKRGGLLTITSAERAAEQLIGMLLGVDLLRSLIGQPLSGPPQTKRRLREAVDVFLAAYQGADE